MFFYKALLFSAIIVGVIILYFFFVGLSDGSITSRNAGLWIILLVVTGAVIGGSFLLKQQGHLQWAKFVLSALAIPGWLALFYLLVVVLSKSRWN